MNYCIKYLGHSFYFILLSLHMYSCAVFLNDTLYFQLGPFVLVFLCLSPHGCIYMCACVMFLMCVCNIFVCGVCLIFMPTKQAL